MTQKPPSFALNRRHAAVAVIGLIGLYVILPQLSSFKSSFQVLRHPHAGWVILAIMCSGLTYAAGALTYRFLANRPLRYPELTLVQLAAMFVNRLLPAGVGAVGTNYAYLRRERHTTAQAATIVAINNLWGFVGHAVLLLIVFAATRGQGVMLGSARHAGTYLLYVLGFVVLVALAGVFGGKRIRKALASLWAQLLSYRKRPQSLLLALVSSMALTALNVLCLYCCMQALNVHLALTPVFLIFSFGVGAGTATPTPGGLGGYEAALVGGFVAYHVAGSPALATALLYRLISYWLALAIGAIAFAICQKRHLFSS